MNCVRIFSDTLLYVTEITSYALKHISCCFESVHHYFYSIKRTQKEHVSRCFESVHHCFYSMKRTQKEGGTGDSTPFTPERDSRPNPSRISAELQGPNSQIRDPIKSLLKHHSNMIPRDLRGFIHWGHDCA